MVGVWSARHWWSWVCIKKHNEKRQAPFLSHQNHNFHHESLQFSIALAGRECGLQPSLHQSRLCFCRPRRGSAQNQRHRGPLWHVWRDWRELAQPIVDKKAPQMGRSWRFSKKSWQWAPIAGAFKACTCFARFSLWQQRSPCLPICGCWLFACCGLLMPGWHA